MRSICMNVSTWSIKNPIPALMLFVLLTFGGLIAFNAMKVQNFPDMDLPTISVTVSLPGASPTQLENDVARKVENSIATLQGLKHIYTKVQDGGATITGRVPPGKAHARGAGRRALGRGARARRPAGRCARPHHHQDGNWPRSRCWRSPWPRRAWTTRRCRGLWTTTWPRSCSPCPAWAP